MKGKRIFTAMPMTVIAVLAACMFSTCGLGLGIEEDDFEYAGFPFFINPKMGGYIFKSVIQIEEYVDQIKKEYFDKVMVNRPSEIQKEEEHWENAIQPGFDSMFNKYNNAFFSRSNLVMVLHSDHAKTRIEIKKIGVKNNELYVRMYRIPQVGVRTDVVGYRCILIPIKKREYNGTKVNIETRTVLW
ncbi:MAG: hypothetical protein FWH41_08530 [Treponema sp.]|nr:hypothetical protein [Treponema sp.]